MVSKVFEDQDIQSNKKYHNSEKYHGSEEDTYRLTRANLAKDNYDAEDGSWITMDYIIGKNYFHFRISQPCIKSFLKFDYFLFFLGLCLKGFHLFILFIYLYRY